MAVQEAQVAGLPDMKVSVRQVFGIDSDMEVPAYSEAENHVPDLDPDYLFDRTTTLAILAGFAKNRRVMVTGYHGTGKSTHIEQVAARLNWPCVRINLDSHVSRIDLAGKDAIEHFDPRKLGKADFLLILNRNENIIPAVAKLKPEQAAYYFMLGETKGTSAGGTHEAGMRSALTKGLRAYGDLTANKKAAQITAEDVLATCAAMLLACANSSDLLLDIRSFVR